MPNSVLRPAVPADRAGFLAMALRSWLDAYATLLAPEVVAGAPAMLERAFDKRWWELRVAVSDQAVLGFYSLGAADDPSHRNYLWHLYVDPEFHRRGVGRALNAAALAEIAGRGETTAWLDVLVANERARAFYRALGWREARVETSDDYDLVILECDVPAPAAGG
ncbi:MAG: GNAT family N-acetyltransferase [bacterium]